MIPADLAARLRLLTEASFFEADQPVREPNRIRAIPADVLQPGRTAPRAEPQAPPALSQIGRLIGTLLAGHPAAGTAPLAAGQPLLASPPKSADPLALALREAVSHSGLFYESHLAQWLSGDLSAAALRQEPQAAVDVPHNGAIPAALLPLVSQQLDALATHQFVWHAQPWPGQIMDWSIDDPAGEAFAGVDEPIWNTTLRLALPRLGPVEARLRLSAEGLSVRLLAMGADAAAALSANREALGMSLGVSRLPLLDLSVEATDGPL
jgi:flagellar hook-length control protein FliK